MTRQDFAQLRSRLEQLMPVTDLKEINEELTRLEEGSVERSVYENLARRWDRRKRLDVGLAVGGILVGVLGIAASYSLTVRAQRQTIEASHVNLPVIAMLANQAKWAEARSLLDQALAIAPADPTIIQQKVHLDADEAVRKGSSNDGLTDYLEHYAKLHPADAKLRIRLAQLYYIQGSHEKALSAARAGLKLAAKLHDETLTATAEHTMANSLIVLGRTEEAVQRLTHSSAIFCGAKDEAQCASSLMELARLSFNQENYMSSLEYLAESETHDKSLSSQAAVSLLRGETRMALGKYDDAAKSLSVALKDFESLGDERGVVYSMAVSGQIASRLGRCNEARPQMSAALKRASTGRMSELVLRTIGLSGEVEENCNNPSAAYTYYLASSIIAKQLQIPPLIAFSDEQVKRVQPKVPPELVAELDANARRLVDGLKLERP